MEESTNPTNPIQFEVKQGIVDIARPAISKPPKAVKSSPESTQPSVDITQIPQTEPQKPRSKHFRKGKRYTIGQKLAVKALQDVGLTSSQVEPITGISNRTIRNIWNDKELDDLSPNVVANIKKGMGGMFYKRSLQGLLAMTPKKYSESSLLQIATTVGIMTEKGRLMENLSTENVSHRSIVENIESDRQKLIEKLNDLGSLE